MITAEKTELEKSVEGSKDLERILTKHGLNLTRNEREIVFGHIKRKNCPTCRNVGYNRIRRVNGKKVMCPGCDGEGSTTYLLVNELTLNVAKRLAEDGILSDSEERTVQDYL